MNFLTYKKLGAYGRLGNQMFQYAALVGIANKLGFMPAIDYTLKSSNTKYCLELDNCFNITSASSNTVQTSCIFAEKDFAFDDSVFSVKPNTDLIGYFQSEKYFQHCKDVIKKEFTFKSQLQPKQYNFPVVSLHVRRGDYLDLQDIYPFSEEYYKTALQYMKQKIKKFVCSVFSDDIDWCKQNIKDADVDFIYNTGTKEQDLQNMANCDHNIITNSSFSWWGAWLNSNPSKTVIAPKTWFGSKGPTNWKDIYCEGWIVL